LLQYLPVGLTVYRSHLSKHVLISW